MRHPIRAVGAAALAATLLVACARGDDQPGRDTIQLEAPDAIDDGDADDGDGDDPDQTPTEGATEPPDDEQPPADPEACDGLIPATTVEKVTVPEGATCVLDGTVVEGDVQVERDATLQARDATITGNLKGRRAASLDLISSAVDGNLELDRLGVVTIAGTTIDGNVKATRLPGPLVLENNRVDGNTELGNNEGGVTLTGNEFDDLKCNGNEPAPEGDGNTIAGDAEGQCADL